MGKHSVKNRTPRNAAIVAAVGVVAGMAAPATVSAAPLAQVSSVLNSGAQQLSQGVAVATASSSTSQAPQQAAPAKATGAATMSSTSTPAHSSSSRVASAPKSTNSGQAIVDAAMSKVGAPYVWGASGPNAFDCSGLTSWAYKQVGKSIPRTSGAQASSGTPVSRANLRPGDIISYYGGASHVAIYIGNNKVVHALNQNSPVRIDNVDYLPVHNIVRF